MSNTVLKMLGLNPAMLEQFKAWVQSLTEAANSMASDQAKLNGMQQIMGNHMVAMMKRIKTIEGKLDTMAQPIQATMDESFEAGWRSGKEAAMMEYHTAANRLRGPLQTRQPLAADVEKALAGVPAARDELETVIAGLAARTNEGTAHHDQETVHNLRDDGHPQDGGLPAMRKPAPSVDRMSGLLGDGRCGSGVAGQDGPEAYVHEVCGERPDTATAASG